ncbi:MAG: tyrosine--tRNA ligase [Halobacteriovoraceae bacterium]|nr:tyrosine--tRNA ligase [Halobacteriovoraceae bacterium]MCB9095697.1 tyrosine--tRNA ligase [Halobacteriovoraceae bacterium]
MDIDKILKSKDFSNSTVTETKKQFKLLNFKISEITPLDEFVVMLAHAIENNKPLRVKCGIDPTGTDVHLGHTIPYRKMAQFQNLGHTGVVIIGDYTAQIGDPTGKNEMRQSLTPEEVKKNAQTYLDQVYTVLNKDRTEIRHQSEWFKNVTLIDVMNWAHQTTVAKLLSHDTFKNRLEEGHSLALHELFYPVLQGIDSVYVKSDVELGGSDQKFNVLMGRDYQKNAGLRPQVAMLLPIIHGTCGTAKMSKSLGNYIGVLDEPFDKFGKVMSIPDAIMKEYAEFASSFSEEEYRQFVSDLDSGKLHPNEAKKRIASNIVAIFHGDESGQKMREQFESVFAKKNVPDEIDDYAFQRGANIIEVLVDSKLLNSNGEARRMIKQNAVSIVDGDKIQDANLTFDESYTGKILKVGKRKFIRLK